MALTVAIMDGDCDPVLLAITFEHGDSDLEWAWFHTWRWMYRKERESNVEIDLGGEG